MSNEVADAAWTEVLQSYHSGFSKDVIIAQLQKRHSGQIVLKDRDEEDVIQKMSFWNE